jgi:hypothetical protein
MKARIILILTVAILWPAAIMAQQPTTWTPIFLDPKGGNLSDGVEAWFQQGTCGNDAVVFVKFINTNEFPVSVQWYNSVFTTELKWINKEKEIKTLKLEARAALAGSCESESVLVIKLSDFISDPSQFKRFTSTNLTVNKVK